MQICKMQNIEYQMRNAACSKHDHGEPKADSVYVANPVRLEMPME